MLFLKLQQILSLVLQKIYGVDYSGGRLIYKAAASKAASQHLDLASAAYFTHGD